MASYADKPAERFMHDLLDRNKSNLPASLQIIRARYENKRPMQGKKSKKKRGKR